MQDVTKDRDKYIGGSDIAAILGISKFKTRWQLLKEKAGIEYSDFTGNAYTEYGNVMEDKIRQCVSIIENMEFVEDKVIEGDMRYHADGVSHYKQTVLEIKTTSTIHEDVDEYDYYLCQLLIGMEMYGYENGILAVYERPEDFSEVFDKGRMTMFKVKLSDYTMWLEYIHSEIDRFRDDWARLKENPFTTEEELQPKEVVDIATKVINLEAQLTLFEEIEAELKEAKAELKENMEKYHVKKWETPSGIKITLVPDAEPTTKKEFNAKQFKEDNPELYDKYCDEVTKKGKAGYVKITTPGK